MRLLPNGASNEGIPLPYVLFALSVAKPLFLCGSKSPIQPLLGHS